MRDILRFPVGRQFLSVLNDDYEWVVVTDIRLKILAMKRGGKTSIQHQTIVDAYQEVIQQKPPGSKIRVYCLHTHPHTQGNAPSQTDMTKFISHKILKKLGVIEVGFGIITRKGILIIRLPENEHKLIELYHTFPLFYGVELHERTKKELDKNTWEEAKEYMLNNMDEPSQTKLTEKMHTRAFRAVLKETPEIKAKTIRRRRRR